MFAVGVMLWSSPSRPGGRACRDLTRRVPETKEFWPRPERLLRFRSAAAAPGGLRIPTTETAIGAGRQRPEMAPAPSSSARLFVDVRGEHGHAAQVAVALCVVEAVSDYEFVGDLEADVLDVDVDFRRTRLAQQRANLD